MDDESVLVQNFRAEFPLLQTTTQSGKRLAYLDNGATSQKPSSVIDAVQSFYEKDNANVHRGVYELSGRATYAYEEARKTVARFIGARVPEEVVFLRGVTEAINLVAHAYLRDQVQAGDEIILSMMEHHANILPWQTLAKEKDLVLRVVPINDAGDLDMEVFYSYLNKKTKLVALTHISNVLGTVNPIREIIEATHRAGAKVLIDGAQATAHVSVDVQDLGVDFYTFSAHKMYGPTGIGVLYAPYDLLLSMQPYQTGGSMIERVTFESSTFAPPPLKFEAGTPHVAGAIGMAKACEVIQSLGFENIHNHENQLLKEMEAVISDFPKVRCFGHSENKVAMATFVYEGVHAHDVATIMDVEGVCVRAGHHCCMPLMDHLGVSATTRASLAMYNDSDDIKAFARGLSRVEEMFYG